MRQQGQIQSQEAAAQASMQKTQAELSGKAQLAKIETDESIRKMQAEAMLKSQLMEKEFQYNMSIRGIESKAIQDREDAKEKKKSERISQQNTEQSKLIEQKKNNLPPINFESNEDTLDGFSFESFGPK